MDYECSGCGSFWMSPNYLDREQLNNLFNRTITWWMLTHIQQNAGIKDPQQATQYAQQAVDLLKEHGNNNPQGLQSLFSNLMGGQSQQNNQNSDKGLLGDVMGGLGI